MSSQHSRRRPLTLDDALVAEYLRDNPEFFQRQRDLIANLQIPHDVFPAVSLVEYQVRVLRDEKRRLKWRLDDLLRVARDNDRVAEQLHHLTMDLLESDSLDSVIGNVRAGLRLNFHADVCRILLIGDDLPDVDAVVLEPASERTARLADRFRGNRPVCGRLSGEQMSLVFDEYAADVRSAAVVPIDDGAARGLIGIGSRDADRYRADHGTVFLRQLGQLVGRAVRRHLPVPV